MGTVNTNEADDTLSQEQITELMHHDPMDFGDDPVDPPEPVAPVEAVTKPAAVTPPAKGTKAPAAVSPAPAPVTPQVPPGALPPAPSQVDLSGLPGQIGDAVRAAMKPEATPADTVPGYMFDIPDQLMNAIGSEDPMQRKQGMQILVAGALKAVHKTLAAEMQKTVETLRTDFPKMIQQQAEQSSRRQAVFTDFYNANKDLNKPELHQFIYAQAVALAQENPNLLAQGWNQTVRDALATRVRGILGWQVPVPNPPNRGNRPPAMLNGGARPAEEFIPEQQKHINDIFNAPAW